MIWVINFNAKDAYYFLKSLAFYKKSLANSPLNNNGVTFDTVLAMACYIVSAVSGASSIITQKLSSEMKLAI